MDTPWPVYAAIPPSVVQATAPQLPVVRLGHSLGCKLHLLAPDGGRRNAPVRSAPGEKR